MGYLRLVTYTLPEEGGVHYAAAGFTPHRRGRRGKLEPCKETGMLIPHRFNETTLGGGGMSYRLLAGRRAGRARRWMPRPGPRRRCGPRWPSC